MGCQVRTHGFSQSACSNSVNDQQLVVMSGDGSVDGMAEFVESFVYAQTAEIAALGVEPFAIGFGVRLGVSDGRALYRVARIVLN